HWLNFYEIRVLVFDLAEEKTIDLPSITGAFMTTLASTNNAFAVGNRTSGLALPAAQNLATLLGRALIAMLFVPACWGKLVGSAGAVGYFQAGGVPRPEVAAAVAVSAELGLALPLLLGYQPRWAALGLPLFPAVITPIFHNYWGVPEAQ